MRLLDPNGAPLPPGTMVRVQMTRSAFHWGTAVNGNRFAKEIEAGKSRYLELIPQLFNTVVMENGHKWKQYDDPERREKTEAVVEWAKQQNLAIRGHVMVWGEIENRFFPMEYHEAMTNDMLGKEDELLLAIDNHIERLGRENPEVYEWDVVNEPINKSALFDYLGAKTVKQRADLVAYWLKEAREAAPQAKLVINEFHILAGPSKRKADRYFDLISQVVLQGAPLDGVGFQNHYWNGNMRRDPDELLAQLDQFAELGLTLSATEWDNYGGKWAETDEDNVNEQQAQADWLETFLTLFYSHPASSSFLMWGFWDGAHWKRSAPLFEKDWTPKPALDVWKKRVLGDWRTDETVQTDLTGSVRLRVHHGEYRISAVTDGKQLETFSEFGPESARGVLELNAVRR